MNIRKFYPMGYALASHTTHCTVEPSIPCPAKIQVIPFLADLTHISNKMKNLFSAKKDIYEIAVHVKELIEKAKEVPQEHHAELLTMVFKDLERHFSEQKEELEVVKYNIFKLKN